MQWLEVNNLRWRKLELVKVTAWQESLTASSTSVSSRNKESWLWEDLCGSMRDFSVLKNTNLQRPTMKVFTFLVVWMLKVKPSMICGLSNLYTLQIVNASHRSISNIQVLLRMIQQWALTWSSSITSEDNLRALDIMQPWCTLASSIQDTNFWSCMEGAMIGYMIQPVM